MKGCCFFLLRVLGSKWAGRHSLWWLWRKGHENCDYEEICPELTFHPPLLLLFPFPVSSNTVKCFLIKSQMAANLVGNENYSIQGLLNPNWHMRSDTFISLSFLDQILSADFLSKISKLFWRWKLTKIGLIWHPAKLIKSYKKFPVALKISIFFALIAHANEG